MSSPLISPTNLQKVLRNLRQFWIEITRTRPLAPASASTRPAPTPPPPGIWGDCGGGIGHLVYRGMGITIPLIFTCVVGIVTSGISGSNITSALLIASVTSILTGYCYTELVTWSSKSSGQIYTLTYQLVGELPAYFIGGLNILQTTATIAVISKALSGTMDFMARGRVTSFVRSNLGELPISHEPPDIIAGGAALVSSVLLAFGLQQAGFLRLVMNVVSLIGVMFFVGVGSAHTDVSPPSHRNADITNTQGSGQLLSGAAVCCCVFSTFYELGRLSKAGRNPHKTLPMATSLCGGIAFLAAFPLGIVLSLMQEFRPPPSNAPLLMALELRDVSWARLIVGPFQLVVTCIGLVEMGDHLGVQLVRLASDGLLPTRLARECQRSFSHATAHLLGGTVSAILALLGGQIPLLKLLSTSILLMNIVLVIVAIYRRHRCSYSGLCSVAASPASRGGSGNTISYHSLRPKHRQTVNIFKDGLGAIPHRVRSAIKAKRNSRSGDESRQPLLHDMIPNGEDGNDFSLINPSSGPIDRINSDDSESDISAGYGTDSSPEEDVDELVAQYREQENINHVDRKIPQNPTPESAKKAASLVFLLIAMIIIIAILLVHGWRFGPHRSLAVALIFIFVTGSGGLLVILMRLPVGKPIQGSSFRIAAAPWIPAIALFLNILLLTELLITTWIFMLCISCVGLVWYLCYSRKHSLLTVRTSVLTDLSSEVICLSPLPIITSSMRQQADSVNSPANVSHFLYQQSEPTDDVILSPLSIPHVTSTYGQVDSIIIR